MPHNYIAYANQEEVLLSIQVICYVGEVSLGLLNVISCHHLRCT
jgi:hypothetical protein